MPRRIIIAGLGFGGFSAARAARGQDRNAEIIVIEKRKDYDGFSPCGIPYAIEGAVPSSALIHDYGLQRMKIDVRLGYEALGVDTAGKVLSIRGPEGEESLSYDSLIISTGSSPFIPPVPGSGLPGVFVVSTPVDGERITAAASKSRSAVVVGAGAIGLETAYALNERGLNVTVVEMLDRPLPNSLDKDMAAPLLKGLAAAGIKALMGMRLESVNGDGKVESVTVDGEEIPADMVIMSVGVRPNIKFLENSGIETGRGIITDERMQTSANDVYAVGDCIESFSLIDRSRGNCWLATAAHHQGSVAGINAAGGDAEYPGYLCTFVSKIGDVEVAATGYTADRAKSLGYDVVSGKAKGMDKPHWYPGAEEVSVKVIADRKDGRILGAQLVGANAGQRVNTFSALITAGATAHTAERLELSYSPPVSDVYDPVITALEVCARKLRK